MATRIRLRYDDEATWDTRDPELLPGEFAVAKKTDGTGILVKVGIESTPPSRWSNAPEISTSGVPGGNIDFSDLDPGEVLYWDGTQWYGRGLDELIGGGNRISVSRNTDGTININYFESTFDVSFSSGGSAPTEEVFNNNNSFPITGVTAKATLVSQNSTVGVDTVTAQSVGTRFTVSGATLPLTSASSSNGTTAETPSFTLTPTAVSTWFGVGSQSATLTAFASSRTTDNNGNSVPSLRDPTSGFANALSKKYQWKVFGFTSDTVLTAANISTFFNTNTPDSKNTLYQNSALTVPTGLYDLANNSALSVYWAFNQPTIQGNSPEFRYLYLLISSQDNANEDFELYGWSKGVPRAFIPVDATNPESGFLPIDSASNHVNYINFSESKNYSYKAFTVIGGLGTPTSYSAQTGLNYVSAKIDVKPS